MKRSLRLAALFLCLSFSCSAPGLVRSVFAQNASTKVDNVNNLIRNGDLAGVKKAFETDGKVFADSPRTQSMLYNAVQSGKADIVKFLMEQKLDPNAETYGNSPLNNALNYWGPEWKAMAEVLVEKGANVNFVDSQGRTPFTNVLNYGGNAQKEKVAWLLSKNADIYFSDRNGTSALDQTLSNASPEIAALVLDKAEVKRTDESGNTALALAVKSNKSEAVKLLLAKGFDIDSRNAMGDTPLHIAAATPGPMLKTLLDAKARTDVKNYRGDLALHVALRRPKDGDPGSIFNDNGAAKPLEPSVRSGYIAPLIAKSDINVRDQFGFSPLLLSVLARDQDSRDLLVARNPKMDSTMQFFDAVSQGNIATVKTLLTQKPFLVYLRLPDGTTPLHVSALWGTIGTAQFLVQKGADVNGRNSLGETPLQETLWSPSGIFSRRAKNMVTFLLGKGANADAIDDNSTSALHRATRNGDTEMIAQLLAKNVNVNGRDKWGYTPLFALMTKTGDYKTAKTLIERGADINIRPSDSNPMLTRAAMANRQDLVELLIDKGALVNVKNSEGRTALGMTISWSAQSGPSVEVAELLLAKGADPNEKVWGDTLVSRIISSDSKEMLRVFLATKKVNLKATENREAPLFQAVNYGRSDMIPMLLEAGADSNELNDEGKTPAQVATERSKDLGDVFKPKTPPVTLAAP